jgi:phosphoglycolate phosphatase-like HAD superfamily hydrolase
MHKLVLFDLDGTLVKTEGAGKKALNRAVKELYGKDDVCSGLSLSGSTDKDNFSRAYAAATGKKAKAKDVALITGRYLACLPEEVENSVRAKHYAAINGVEKFIFALKKTGSVIVALGTGNIKEGACIKLAPSGLAAHFECGGFGCDGFERIDMLRAAVKRASKLCGEAIPPSHVYVIGDTAKDVAAGKLGGYHTAAVSCGFGSQDELMHSAPELLAEDFSDLEPWMIWLGLDEDPLGVQRASYMFPDCAIEHVQFGRSGMDTAQLRLMRRIKKDARRQLAKKAV